MILNFTDDYVSYMTEGRALLGRIITMISTKEPYLGNVRELDRFYYISITLSALLDHLESDNNSIPEDNEYLLQCLKSILTKNIC